MCVGCARAGKRLQQCHTLVSSNRPKKEREKKDPNSLMELFQTHYISQLFCGLNYDDITGQLQMQKTHISDLIFQCGPS